MQVATFNAKCPVEIGDKVTLPGGQTAIITDIACVHYVKSGQIEFRYELDGSGQYLGFVFEK